MLDQILNPNSKTLEHRDKPLSLDPEELPLSEPEKSILGKDSSFVPLNKKGDEFDVRRRPFFSSISRAYKTYAGGRGGGSPKRMYAFQILKMTLTLFQKKQV